MTDNAYGDLKGAVEYWRNAHTATVTRAQAAETKLRDLTAILCTEEGQDVVERAKALANEEQRVSELLDADLLRQCRELRTALTEKDAAYKELDEKYTFALNEHEKELERAEADAKRSGYVAAVGALHNAMPPGFVEPDTDKVIGRVAALAASKDAELAKLRAQEIDRNYALAPRSRPAHPPTCCCPACNYL